MRYDMYLRGSIYGASTRPSAREWHGVDLVPELDPHRARLALAGSFSNSSYSLTYPIQPLVNSIFIQAHGLKELFGLCINIQGKIKHCRLRLFFVWFQSLTRPLAIVQHWRGKAHGSIHIIRRHRHSFIPTSLFSLNGLKSWRLDYI